MLLKWPFFVEHQLRQSTTDRWSPGPVHKYWVSKRYPFLHGSRLSSALRDVMATVPPQVCAVILGACSAPVTFKAITVIGRGTAITVSSRLTLSRASFSSTPLEGRRTGHPDRATSQKLFFAEVSPRRYFLSDGCVYFVVQSRRRRRDDIFI